MLTTADNLYGNHIRECITGDSLPFMFTAVAQDFIYRLLTIRFVTVVQQRSGQAGSLSPQAHRDSI